MGKYSLWVRKVPRSELHRPKKYHITLVVILGKSLAPIASLSRVFLVPVVCLEYAHVPYLWDQSRPFF